MLSPPPGSPDPQPEQFDVARRTAAACHAAEQALRYEAMLVVEGPGPAGDVEAWRQHCVRAGQEADRARETFRQLAQELRTRRPVPARAQPRPAGAGFPLVDQATSLDAACHALADALADAGFALPSVYLLAGERLRCRAARGYFQVIDGFRPGTGVVGQVVATGRSRLLADVREHPEFIAAVPGLRSEAAVPVFLHDRVVGALSVESTTELPAETTVQLEVAAGALSRALERLGGLPRPSLAQQLAHLAVEISSLREVEVIRRRALEGALELSGMAAAALVERDDPHELGGLRVVDVSGRLAGKVLSWEPEQLAVLAASVDADTSSHYPGGSVAPPGYEFLRQDRISSLSVHPLVAAGVITGYLLLVNDRPTSHAPHIVDCLELLAAQVGSALSASAVVAELSHRAQRDELTGLGNRLALKSAMSSMLGGSPTADGDVGLILVDLDDFKHVNDFLGHHVGDRLLVQVAEAILGASRDGDLACRLGGDEFALVLPGADVTTATAVADRILAALASIGSVDGANLHTSASIGVVVERAGTASTSQLLKAADLAMYLAKQQGKGRWALFDEELQQVALARLSTESDLRTALDREQLHLVFQPIVDITTGAMTAVEALARWDHPLRGAVSPVTFIPVAEETGMIIELGAWALRTACDRLRSWSATPVGTELRMTVNVSTRQLEDPALLEQLDACLAAGLEPSRLILEITETALATDTARVASTLQEIRERGVHLAVDDFGTGYSSLSRLGSAPISRLKIDRSFIAAITSAQAHVPLVEATMAMATGLGLGVVAEGVETPEQLAHLRALHCPEVQGYLFSRPLSEAQLQPLLQGERPWAALVETATATAAARPVGLSALIELAFRKDVTIEELSGPLLAQAAAATGLRLAFVNRLDLEADHLRVLWSTEDGDGPIRPGGTLAWSRSICCRLLAAGSARVSDVRAHEGAAPLGAKLGLGAFLSEPVWGPHGELWGTLCAASPHAQPLTENDSATFRLLANLLTEKVRQESGQPGPEDSEAGRVIVIDDDAVMRELVGAMLSGSSSHRLVGTAVDGADGVALAAAQQPDVVVLDFELPDLSAAVVLERLRHASRRSRVVLYSGRADIHAIGQRLGVDRSVYKGDGIERLHEALSVL